MIYRIPKFRAIDRGYKESMLLIPGWATDPGIFELLDLPYNYVVPEGVPPLDFDKVFARSAGELKSRPLHLFGWSMGGFMGASCAAKYPAIFKSVTLVSVRQRYERNEIEKIKRYMRKNAKAYLRKFYEKLFSESEVENRRWFAKRLWKRYLDTMSPESLLEGLEYLSRTELELSGLTGSGVIFVHGDADEIAPIEEARAATARVPKAEFFAIHGAGHLPFLGKDFRTMTGL